jgi:5'(3')-deoxyribonucleotidase
MLIVGVDVDGVLGEQVPPVLDRIKREGKSTDLAKDKIVEWDFRIDDTDISREIEKALLDPSFVTSMPLVEGSVSAMRELYKKYHVVIVTSRPIETEQETRDWLKRNFRFHEFINTRECGKNDLGLNVLVDDNLDNVRKFASSKCYALLFSQPWNLKVKDKDLEELLREKRVIRVQNWDEATMSIAKIERALIRST